MKACIVPLVLIIKICLSSAFTAPKAFGSSSAVRKVSIRMAATEYPELERCLFKEYTSFFTTLDESFYSKDVSFLDPITKFTGIDKYKNNIDLIAGRTSLARRGEGYHWHDGKSRCGGAHSGRRGMRQGIFGDNTRSGQAC